MNHNLTGHYADPVTPTIFFFNTTGQLNMLPSYLFPENYDFKSNGWKEIQLGTHRPDNKNRTQQSLADE